MSKPETRLRKKIVTAILGAWPKAYVRKIHGSPYQNKGIADLLCSIDGFFFALEVKRPGKEATEAQALEGRKVLTSHGVFGVVTSPQEAISLIRRGLSWQFKRVKRTLDTGL